MLLGAPASATLLDLGSITRDTASGLDWLDVSESVGFTFDEIEAGVGGFGQAGWRHANTAEVCGLFTQFASFPCPGNSGFGFVSEARALIELVGSAPNPLLTSGLFADGQDPQRVGDAVANALPIAGILGINLDAIPVDAIPRGGHSLVRPIPEASTALLLALGLVGMGVRRRTPRRVACPPTPRRFAAG